MTETRAQIEQKSSQTVSLPVRPLRQMLADNFTAAFAAIAENRLRSLLTLSGIVVGVLAITTLIAILQGVKAQIASQVKGLGANLIVIVPSRLNDNGQPDFASLAGISTLTPADVQALKHVPGVKHVSPVYFISGTVGVNKANTTSAFVVATNLAGVQMNPTRLQEGRYFQNSESGVCILGYKPAHKLFGNVSPVGRSVDILGKTWKVAGELAKPPNDGTLGSQIMALDTLVYLPAAAAKQIPGCQINRIALQTDYKHPASRIIGALKAALLKSHHGADNFGIITQKKGLELVDRMINLAQELLVLIATISLFVAGIGIMNIMLVTVTERTREIGIRKTVGARRHDIFVQFLTEALTLSLLGGAAGLLLSAALCTLIAHFSLLHPIITFRLIALALLVCSVVGVVFGVTPAARAARLDPIAALRHE